jgi:hypothetical protein
MLERINTFFLLRDLTNVMHQIIENKVNNVSFYTTHNTWANVERLLKMEQIMNHVRHTGGSLQWTQMVSRIVDESEELEVTLAKILHYLFEPPFNVNVYHICCLHTYISDVCVLKIQRHKPVNLNHIYKVLHDVIVEKTGTCILQQILNWLYT